MSDIQDWLDERRRIHAEAAQGEWWWEGESDDDWPDSDNSLMSGDEAVVVGWGYDASGIHVDDNDALYITDALNTLPKALSALRNVRNFCIAAHLPAENYGEYGQGYNKALSEVMSALQEAINDEE